jgi:ribonuclease Z
VIREKKKPRKIDKTRVLASGIPAVYYERLKNGDDYETREGMVIKNETVTIPNKPPRSYAYCADTIYDESLCSKVHQASLLYHESTYLKDLAERARSRFHSTTEQAANIAKKAEAERLLIGHFSSKYENLHEFLDEAKAVFLDTELAIEGVTYIIN